MRRARELWKFECGECGAVLMYRDDIDEMPPDWYRLENRAQVFVCCSVRCLSALVETLEPVSPS